MSHYLRLGLVPAYLALCLMLGGASAAGHWANMILQLLAIPLIYWALVVRRSTPMATPARWLIALMCLILLLIGLQLIPLPPGIWTALPGRERVADGFRLLREPLPWLTLSLAPRQTLASALWLLPAIAVLLGMVRLGNFKPAWLAWSLVSVTALAVLVGALQVTGGEASGWYLYKITNVGVNTGFFANGNHMATLMVATIPFLAALYLASRGRDRSAQKASGTLVILAGAMAVIVVGLAINRSLAGLGLAVPVALASLLMLRTRKSRTPVWALPVLLAVAGGSIALAFSAPVQRFIASEGMGASPQSRIGFAKVTLAAAQDFLPVGTGVGTFPDIYPSYEDESEVERVYVNHAHGDYFELALETGVPGVVLILLFFAWWVRRVATIWRAEEPDYFARAATIASAAILVHSVVDYPLRTAAISALFAALCALMAGSRPRTRRTRSEQQPAKARHLSAD
jgi:O-antigen ligase